MLQHTKTTRKGTGIIKMIEHKEHFHGSDLEKIEKIYGISKENIINFEDRAEEINISSDKKLIEKIISKLKNYLVENKNIPGIAAPQLGYNKRIFCIKNRILVTVHSQA